MAWSLEGKRGKEWCWTGGISGKARIGQRYHQPNGDGFRGSGQRETSANQPLPPLADSGVSGRTCPTTTDRTQPPQERTSRLLERRTITHNDQFNLDFLRTFDSGEDRERRHLVTYDGTDHR
jgi:hypothetical protein